MVFSDVQLDDIRERADLVSLVGRRVQLKKTGKDFTGLCPFHGERTPSFYVVPQKQMWHCFGCGESGDIFRFFMKLDGLPFVECVRQVASDAGILLIEEQPDPEEIRRKHHLDELSALLERAVKFYEHKLAHDNGRLAREHLKARGVSDESSRKFHLGFGGHGMDELSRALAKAGASQAFAVEAGLSIEGNRGTPFDRFHGRLIVPIRVPRPPDGRAIGLGGRFLPGVTPERLGAGAKTAKYINSPETPLYQKGSVLYALDQARDAIRKEERAVIVEGYFDVIGLHQAGLPLAVASCGTSLTPGHLELLTRTGAKELVFLFDGDPAGVRAATKAAELCAKAQVPGRVATLPDGLDPDDYARQKGLDGLQALLDRSRPCIEVLIDHALGALGPSASVEDRVRAVHSVRPVVMAAPEGLARELYISQIAERLKVSPEAIKASLQEGPAEPRPGVERERASGPRTPQGPRGRPNRSQPDDAPDENATPEPPDPRRPERGPSPRTAPASEGAAVAAAQARRSLELEEAITVSLLKFPVLAVTVAENGILGDFANPSMRAISERVIAAMAAREQVRPAEILLIVADPAHRASLARKLAEDEANLEDTVAHLGKVLDRLRIQFRREKAKTVLAAHAAGQLPTDDAGHRALAEEGQRLLEEQRRLHVLKRERERPK